jgi:ribosomal protein S18 acetylase RimI-like enzyme
VTRAYVYALRVRPAYRGMGVGTRLIQNSETDLFKRGFRHITLNVSRDNLPALHLYKRLGYRIVAADPGRWSYLDEKGVRHNVHEPAWRMEKMLNSLK